MNLKTPFPIFWIGLILLGFLGWEPIAVADPDGAVPISGSDHPPIKDLDQVMLLYLQKINCTAAALAISKGDSLLYERSYGWLDQQHKIPAPTRVLIGIASCEKPITAAASRKLAAEGKFNLNAPLFQTLGIQPAGKIVDRRVNQITFEDLLDHTAGWGGDIRDELARAARASGAVPPFTIPVLLAQAMSRPLKSEPGKTFEYSNFGFDVMRYVVELESHKSPGFYFRERLLLKSNCPDIGEPEDLPSDQRAARAVWNLQDGGPIFASARYLCFFMDEYWYTGLPRGNDRQIWIKSGGLNGSTSEMVWRQDGLNIAFIFNGRSDAGKNEDIRAALENVVNQNIWRLENQ